MRWTFSERTTALITAVVMLWLFLPLLKSAHAADPSPATFPTALQPHQTGWISTGALSRVPVFDPTPSPPPAPRLQSVSRQTNWHGDPVGIPVWDAPPAGETYRLYRSDDGENWSVVADREGTGTGGARYVPVVQDPMPGRLALYRLTAVQGGVESGYSNVQLATAPSLCGLDEPGAAVGTSALTLSSPTSIFLEFSPRPGLTAGVYTLVSVGSNYPLLNLQVRPDGSYSVYCIASIGGTYRTLQESRYHTGRSAYLVVLDGPRSHMVVDGVDDPQSHGDMTGFAESGAVQVQNCGTIGTFRVLDYVPTVQEQGVLFGWAAYLSGTPYRAVHYDIIPGRDHTIVASLRPDTDPPIDFGPVSHEVHVTPDGDPAGDGSLAHPQDLATALANTTTLTGTTIWLHSGWYRSLVRPSGVGGALGGGWTVTLTGAPGHYIQVRPWPGNTVVLDGVLNVQSPSAFLVLRDLVSTISEARHPARDNQGTVGRPPWAGFELFGGSHVVLLDDVVYDCSQGVEDWTGNQDGLVYGCVLSDNGWDDPQVGPRGHNIYVQNNVGAKRYERDISVRSYGLVLHGYGHGAISGLDVEGCVFAGGNVLLGSQSGGDDLNTFSDNVLFSAPTQLGYQGTNSRLVADRNVLTGPIASLDTTHYQQVTGTNTLDPNHSGDAVLWGNAYDPQRWNLAVWGYGSEGTETVTMDLSAVLRVGDHYELRRAGGYCKEPPVVGIYRGPMVVRLGGMWGAGGGAGEGMEPPSSHFDVFVLRRLVGS